MTPLNTIRILRSVVILMSMGLGLLFVPQRAMGQATNNDILDDECFDVTGNTGCDVEGVSDISAFTDALTIDTFVATYINDFTILDSGYSAVVDGQLLDQSGQLFDFVEQFDDGSGQAIGFMDDPIVYSTHGSVLDDVYEVEGFHDLVDDFGDDFPIGETLIDAPIGAPTITGIGTPDYGFVGTSGTVTIEGTDLVDPFFGMATVSPSSGTGLLVAVQDVSGDPFGTEFMTVAYSISQCASTGPRFIVVSNEFGSDTGDWQFTVGDPPPIIVSVTPGAWQAGTSFTATINGTGFGTSPGTTIVGQGVTFTVNSASDTQIAVNVTVASNAPQQTVTATVQSNGYCGSGFQAAYPGEASTSTYGVPVAPAAPTPQIQLYQQNITSTESVLVGQQMALRAVVILPAGVTINSQQWSTPPGTAVGGYTNPLGIAPCLLAANCPIPDTTGGNVLSIPSSTGDSSSSCGTPPANTFYSCYTFYWVDSANSRQITYTYQASTNASSSATVTFNVDGLSGATVGAPPGKEIQSAMNIYPPPTLASSTNPILAAGDAITALGIDLLASASHLPPGCTPSGQSSPPQCGKYQWVQLIKSDVVKQVCASGPKTITDPPSSLDNIYPYPGVSTTNLPNDGAEDSPAIALLPSRGEAARSFNALMYLMWVPPVLNGCNNGNTCTIPVPLGYFDWSIWGDGINTLQIDVNPPSDLFPVWNKNAASPSDNNHGFVVIDAFPTWTTTSTNGALPCG